MADLAERVRSARETAEAFVAAATEAGEAPQLVDGWEGLLCECPLADVDAALRASAAVVEAGGQVELTLERLDESCTFTSLGADSWSASGALKAVAPTLADERAHATWTTDDLRGAGIVIDEGSAQVSFDKRPWKELVERARARRATGPVSARSVWVGLSAGGLARWLAEMRVDGVVEQLFDADRTSAHVLLGDWEGPPLELGTRKRTRMRIGSLSDAWDGDVEDDEVLVARLEAAMRMDELPSWRAIDLDGAGAPPQLRPRVDAVAAVTAAGLVGPAAPAWTLPTQARVGTCGGQAVVALARWVAADYGEGRLSVAKSVALAEIADPLAEGGADAVQARAEIAFAILVDEKVREALATRERFETAYRDLDDKVAQVNADVAQQADQAIVRALTGTLGVAIAALASARVRDWPATAAAFVLAGYLIANAGILWSLQRDALRRLGAAEDLARRRDLQLGEPVLRLIDGWREGLRRRVRRYAAALTVLAVLIAAVGVIANEQITGIRIVPQEASQPQGAATMPRGPAARGGTLSP